MANNLIETKWGIFSDKFVKFHHLPFGSELRLFDRSGRKKRTDFLVKRRRISSKTMSRITDSATVSSLLNAALQIMSTDLEARGLEIKLFDPNGQQLHGNTLISNVRQMEPKLSEDDINRIEEEEHAIGEIQSNALAEIIESEYLIDDPSTTICTAYIRALIQRYGRAAVIIALGR